MPAQTIAAEVWKKPMHGVRKETSMNQQKRENSLIHSNVTGCKGKLFIKRNNSFGDIFCSSARVATGQNFWSGHAILTLIATLFPEAYTDSTVFFGFRSDSSNFDGSSSSDVHVFDLVVWKNSSRIALRCLMLSPAFRRWIEGSKLVSRKFELQPGKPWQKRK